MRRGNKEREGPLDKVEKELYPDKTFFQLTDAEWQHCLAVCRERLQKEREARLKASGKPSTTPPSESRHRKPK